MHRTNVLIFILSFIFPLCRAIPSNYGEIKHKNNGMEQDVMFDDIPANGELFEDDIPANGELFEGDIMMDDRLRRAVLGEKSKKSALILEDDMLWRDGILYYEVEGHFTLKQTELLQKTIKEYEKRTCIRFKKRKHEEDYLVFSTTKDECSSYVGKRGGRQVIHLGKHCDILGTYEHEVMHALGFIHEHSRPDRDDYITIIYENIKKKLRNNFKKYSMDEVNNVEEKFNYASIMLYRNDAFTKNGDDTIEAVGEPKLMFGQRITFSVGDVKQINILYKCKNKLEHPNYHKLFKEYHGNGRKRKDALRRRRFQIERKDWD